MKKLKTCLVILCLLSIRTVGLPQSDGANFFMGFKPTHGHSLRKNYVCANCGIFFSARKKLAKNYFCSKICYHTWKADANNPNYRGGDISHTCEHCNGTFYIRRDRKTSQTGRYCSIRCYHDFLAKNKMPKIHRIIHGRMKHAVRRMVLEKKSNRKWEDLVGYNASDLANHLESLFKEGMSFSNYGKWHIDHIIPVSVFRFTMYSDAEFKICWSLKNLQPLWASENIAKSGSQKLTKKQYLEVRQKIESWENII